MFGKFLIRIRFGFVRYIKLALLIQEPLYTWIVRTIFFMIILHILYVLFTVQALGDVIVLHENIYFGIDFIGSWYYIFGIVCAGVIVAFFHYILGGIVYAHDRELSYFLIIGALIMEVLFFAGSFFIIRANL